MSDPAAPSLQVCLSAAQSPARMPPAFDAELPLHTRRASAPPAEEVTQAGDCTGAASQAAGKLPLPHPASAGRAVGMARTGAGNGAEVPMRALGDGDSTGEFLALLKSVLALPALPSRT